MLVYFDNCAINRPLDSRNQSRVASEADAMEVLLFLCMAGGCELLASDVLYFETSLNTDMDRREFVEDMLSIASNSIAWSASLANRVRELERRGFRAMDAWHLASAEAGLAERFCSCDTRLVRRARKQTDLPFQVVTPIELLQELLP